MPDGAERKWQWGTLAALIMALLTMAGWAATVSAAGAARGSSGPDLAAGILGENTSTPTATATCSPNYTLSTSTGSIVLGTQDIGNHCDDCNTTITLPFPYRFYGQTFNSANASSNGTLQFSSNVPSFSNDCLPSTLFGLNNFIAAMWDDLDTGSSEGDGIFTSVSGVAPNRIFNIEWRACVYDPVTYLCDRQVNFEIRLYEGQERFDIVFGTVSSNATDATVGVQRATGTAYSQYTCNGNGLAPDLLVAFARPACGTPTPTVTGTPPTNTPTYTPTNTRSPTITTTPTITPAPIATCGPNSNYDITTSMGSIVPGMTDVGNHCDDCNTGITLPFTYRLYGHPFNSANVSSNGTLQFASNYPLGYGPCVPSTFFDYSFAIFPFMTDLRTDYSLEQGVFTSVSGIAPKRIFNIEWRASLYSTNEPANFEIRLYEGEDHFDIVYGQMPNSYSHYYFAVGAQRDSIAYTEYQCNGTSPTSGLLLTFTQPSCGSPTPTVTGTPPTATSTNTSTGTRTPTGTVTPNLNTGYAHLAPSSPITVTLGSTFTLDLMVNAGMNSAAAQQSYLTFTNAILQVADSSTGSCVVSGTISPDTSTFDAILQNEMCNSSQPCDFGQIIAPPASIAFASGALNNPPASGDFRVAEVTFCASTLGSASVHWQFSPPAPNTRNSEILDDNGTRISNPGLYTDYAVHVVPNTNRVLVGHVTWQGRPPQPSEGQQVPITLTLKSGTTEVNYPVRLTDASGFFTVPVGTLPTGTYSWRVKSPRFLSNGGTVSLTGDPLTNVEMGLMRAGDANNDNVVTSSDFIILRPTFGRASGDPAYDARADFNGDEIVNTLDFNLLRNNFGTGGAPPISP